MLCFLSVLSFDAQRKDQRKRAARNHPSPAPRFAIFSFHQPSLKLRPTGGFSRKRLARALAAGLPQHPPCARTPPFPPPARRSSERSRGAKVGASRIPPLCNWIGLVSPSPRRRAVRGRRGGRGVRRNEVEVITVLPTSSSLRSESSLCFLSNRESHS